MDKIDALKKLKVLLDSGAINQEEFAAMKANILDVAGQSPVPKPASVKPPAPAPVTAPVPTPVRPTRSPPAPTQKPAETAANKSDFKDRIAPAATEPAAASTQQAPAKTPARKPATPQQKPVAPQKEAASPVANAPRDKSKPRIKTAPKKSSDGKPVSFTMVPKSPSAEAQEVKAESGPNDQGLKEKGSTKKWLIIAACVLVLGGSIGAFFMFGGSAVEAEAAIVYEDKYVFSARLALFQAPQNDGSALKRINFGDKVTHLMDTVIGGDHWTKLKHNGDVLWAITSGEGTDYLTDQATVNQFASYFVGARKQYIFEKMPAFAKLTLIDYLEQSDHEQLSIVCNESHTVLPVNYFRSRMGNRSSSTDKRAGRNLEAKDMAVLFHDDANSERDNLVVFAFDEKKQSRIIWSQEVAAGALGLERLKRRSTQEHITNHNYSKTRLEHDALVIQRPLFEGSEMLYGEDGNLQLIELFEMGDGASVRNYINENWSNLDCHCEFPDYDYDLKIHDGVALLSAGVGNEWAYRGSTKYDPTLEFQELTLLRREDIFIVEISDGQWTDEANLITFSRRCTLSDVDHNVFAMGGIRE